MEPQLAQEVLSVSASNDPFDAVPMPEAAAAYHAPSPQQEEEAAAVVVEAVQEEAVQEEEHAEEGVPTMTMEERLAVFERKLDAIIKHFNIQL